MTDGALTILDYAIGPMRDSELNLIYDSWMRSAPKWRRNTMYKAIERGKVLVARDGDFVFGWLCVVGDSVAHGWVRDSYRRLGLMRDLWEQAGRPGKILPPATKDGFTALARLTER